MRVLGVAIALACAVGVAAAGPADAAPAKPWAAGVSDADQQQALALYDKGNGYFAQDQFKEALAQYKDALRHWDHPAIRYNAAVCEINLGRDVDAYDDLIAAMKYGAEPIGADHFAQAKTYERLLEGKVAELQVTCNQPGAEVRLDGQLLFHAPGSDLRRVTVGEHQIVGVKPGFEPETRTIRVEPGKGKAVVELVLHPVAAPRRLVRHWARWKPWAIAAGGVAVAALGVPLWQAASTHYASYDRFVAACAGRYVQDPHCPDADIPGSVRDLKSQGDLDREAEIAAFVAGGALAAAGIALVVWNQPHLEQAAVVPAVGPDHVGVTLTGRW